MLHVGHSIDLHDVLHVGERPCIRIGRDLVGQLQPRSFQVAERHCLLRVIRLQEHPGSRTAALSLHPLRESFLYPSRCVRARFLPDEAVRQLVLQHARQFRRQLFQSLYRHANAPVIQRTGPAWRARDVRERLLRVQNHPDRFRRSVTQLRFDGGKMYFQSAEHLARQSRLRLAAVAQRKVAAFVLAVIFFLLLIALCLVERRLHLDVRPERQGAFPFRDGLAQLVHPVIRPAGELGHVGIVRSNALRAFQIVKGLLVFAAPQVQVCDV